MSHYKELNKELVEQVQNMKIQLNLYCNEIVCLKRDMMQKHEAQVFLRKKCFNWAVENFKKLIETVEPECLLIENIRQYEPQIDVLPSMNRNSSQRNNSLRSSNENRRSSQLRVELQRSNNIIHSRKSMCSTSPVRQSSAARSLESDMDIDDEPSKDIVESSMLVNSDHIIFEESEYEVEELESGNEFEMAQGQKSNEKASETLHVQDIERTIYEESEATEVQETNNAENSQYESVEEITIDISNIRTTVEESHIDGIEEISIELSPSRRVLSNITNTTNSQNQSTQKHKYGLTASRRTQNSKQHLTSNEEGHTSMDSSPVLTRGRKCRFKISDNATQEIVEIGNNKSRLTDFRPKSMEVDESIQEKREELIDKYNDVRRKSIRIPKIIANEVSMARTSFAVNDLTLQNFNTAVASSTPNSRHNSVRNVSENTSSDSPSLLTTTNSRPSRKCKPKSLVEPNLSRKMRNETEKPLITTKAGKSKSKKKK